MDEFFEVVQAGERNTFPSIPRIRAHCLVETTLEKCVQRLRKRLTDESAHAKQQEMLRLQSAETNDPHLSIGRKKMDRTPSFYTSRSIVNLSGLSVSDPLPLPSNNYSNPNNNNGSGMSAPLPVRRGQQADSSRGKTPPLPVIRSRSNSLNGKPFSFLSLYFMLSN